MGLKPSIDTWRVITGAEKREKKKFSLFYPWLVIELLKSGLNRCTFVQMFRIVLSVAANDAISTIQYFTVISSFAAIGFIFAIMDYEVVQMRIFDELIPRYMAGFQRQNQSGYSLLFFPCFRHQHMPQCALLRARCLCVHLLHLQHGY